MALHLAEQIMSALFTTLNGLTTTGTNIERGRVYPFDESVKNGLSLMMGPDTELDEDEQSFDTIDSELTVYIDSHVKTASVQVDTQLNLIRAEVTVALMADHTQGGLVIDTNEAGSDEPDRSGDSDMITAKHRNTYTIHYRRSRTDPTVG